MGFTIRVDTDFFFMEAFAGLIRNHGGLEGVLVTGGTDVIGITILILEIFPEQAAMNFGTVQGFDIDDFPCIQVQLSIGGD
jgi:hypothetical protein